MKKRTTKAQRIIHAADAGFHILLVGAQGVGKTRACDLLRERCSRNSGVVTQLFLSCNGLAPEYLVEQRGLVDFDFKTSDYSLLKKELGKMVHNVHT